MARYSGRKLTTGRARISYDGLLTTAVVVDLSIPGCLIRTSLRLQRGQFLSLHLHVPDQPVLGIELAVVRWAMGGEAGLEFIRMLPDDASRLQGLVCGVGTRVTRTHSWSEPVMWTGISGL